MGRSVTVVAAAIVAAVAVGWGAAQVLDPEPVTAVADDYTLVTVAPGQVGQSLSLNAVAQWQAEDSGTNRAAGIVTAVVVDPGQLVSAGSPLYVVNGRAVAVAQGQTPAYRDMSRGAEGDDVSQLQAMLRELGYLDSEPDGDFGAATEAAVMRWQKSLDIAGDGIVRLGDVVFAPAELPARLTVDSDVVYRDALLSGGEKVLSVLPADPTFTVPVTAAQSAMIADGTMVAITSPEGQEWQAEVSGRVSRTDADGMDLQLIGTDGGSIAGDQGAQVPVVGETVMSALIEIVPQAEGLVVPAAALRVEGDGSTVVIDGAGELIPVDVQANASGLAIVSGVEQGVQVRTPAWSTEDSE